MKLVIDRIVVETDVEREQAARIPEVIRRAFLQLAERWARSSWARSISLARVVRRYLEVTPVSTDELLGPSGADLLADRMWRAVVASVVEAA